MADDPNLEIDPDWTPPVETPEKKKPDAPDPIAQLQAQLDQERAARIEAQRKANELAQSAHRSQNEVVDSQMALVNSAIDRVKEYRANIKAAKVQAMANGDWDSVAELDEQLADEAAKLLQLENGKAAMEAQERPGAPQPIVNTDPVEALAEQLSPRSAAWVRAHPEYARDPRLQQMMLAAHNLVTGRGIAPDTDEYFEGVERALDLRKPARVQDVEEEDGEDPMAAAAKATPRQAAPPAAPVSRGGSSGHRAILSAAEKEAAKISGQTEQEYAKSRDEMIKQGRIGKERYH